MSVSIRLEQLTRVAQQLNNTVTSGDTVLKDLVSLRDETKRMAGGGAPLGLGGPSLLALDRNKIVLDSASTFAFVPSLAPVDMEGYLKHEHDSIISNAIDEYKNETNHEFETRFTRSMESEWEHSKKRILDDFFHRPDEPMLIEKEPPMASKTSVQIPFGGATYEPFSLKMFPKQKLLSQQVAKLNDARLENKPYPIVSSFKQMTEKLDPVKNVVISECWDILYSIVDEKSNPSEFEYRKYQSSETPKSNESTEMRQFFMTGIKSYLEKHYLEYIKRTVESHPTQAQLGGKPDIENWIRAFLKVKMPAIRDPIWPLYFYLFRCGHAEKALQLLKMRKESLRDFTTALEIYVQNPTAKLPRELSEKLRREYTVENIDPFKYLLFKIVGRFDIDKKTVPEVIQATEDYIWLQLHLIRDSPFVEQDAEEYKLIELQQKMVELGPTHFNSQKGSPLKYFQVLLLTAQFERAIDFLYQSSTFRTEAVHFAIALAYYGLIRFLTPDHLIVGILKQDGVTCYLNFASMIVYYIKDFTSSDAEDAIHYLLLLCLGSNLTSSFKTYQEICKKHILNVIFDSRQYYLLGEARVDGRKSGFLDRYAKLISREQSAEDIMRKLIDDAAKLTEEKGDFEKAIIFYNLENQYSKVLEILERTLSENLFMPQPELTRNVKRVLEYYENKSTQLTKKDNDSIANTKKLLKLAEFFALTLVESQNLNQIEQALKVIQETKILPLDDSDFVPDAVLRYSQLPGSIKSKFEKIIEETMNLLHNNYLFIKNSPKTEPQKERLRNQAKKIVIFLGQLNSDFSHEIYAHAQKREQQILAW